MTFKTSAPDPAPETARGAGAILGAGQGDRRVPYAPQYDGLTPRRPSLECPGPLNGWATAPDFNPSPRGEARRGLTHRAPSGPVRALPSSAQTGRTTLAGWSA